MKALEKARNGFGEPLCPESTQRLRDFFQSPTETNWNQIYSIVLRDRNGVARTVWQAVTYVVPGFQTQLKRRANKSKVWDRIPTVFEVGRAIRDLGNPLK